MSNSRMKTVYELYDGRYLTRPERAICYEVCETIKEARQNKDEYGDDTFIVKTVLKEIGERKYEQVSSEIVL